MGRTTKRGAYLAHLGRMSETISDANNLVQMTIGVVTLLLSIVAGWRFGLLAGVVVFVLCLLAVSFVAGARAEAEAQKFQAEREEQPQQQVFVPMISDADVQRQLLENAEALAALQAQARRRDSWSSMAQLAMALEEGPPLFEALRSADYKPEGRMNEATVRGRLLNWSSGVSRLTRDLFPEVPEGFHMPYIGHSATDRGDPPPSVRMKAEEVIVGYERFHGEWSKRVTEHYRSLPADRRPGKYRD